MSRRTLAVRSIAFAALLFSSANPMRAEHIDPIGLLTPIDNTAPSKTPKSVTPQSPTPNLATPSAPAPPSSSKVLMCVQRDLVDLHAWDHPAPGSRMAAFRKMAIPYIQSIGRPGWEYWILDVHYNRFDPRQPADASALVVQLSPASGRFNPANPSCPAKYAGYWLDITHK